MGHHETVKEVNRHGYSQSRQSPLSPLRRGGAFACTALALIVLLGASAAVGIGVGSVIMAPAYPGNQVEGAGFAVLLIWAPALLIVGLLGAAGLFLAATGLGVIFIAVSVTCDLVSAIYISIVGGIGPPLLAVVLLSVFMFVLNVGAVYGAWVFVFHPLLGRR